MKRIICDLPGHEGEWIERVDRVSVKQWNDWRKADHDRTQELFIELIDRWNLKGVDGKPAIQPVNADALDALELALLPWLVRAIQESIIDDMALLPNKSSASPTS